MKFYLFFITICTSLFLISCSGDEDDSLPSKENPVGVITTGTGKVTYTDYQPLQNKPVNLFYSIPEGDMSSMPIVLVLPGTNRDADNYIVPWIELSKTYHCMVFSIEFPEAYYTDDEYITGNVINKSGNFVPKEKWTFSIIEPIFQ